MKLQALEARMREGESFRSLRIAPGQWTVMRLDGRVFGRFTAGRFHKPFDRRLRDCMIEAATALFADFQGCFAYIFSDEVSVAFPSGWDMFDGRVEKLVSLSAGLLSARFTRAAGEAAHFDSRLWQSGRREEVIEYFRWRQIDAARCALHSWCYWTLRRAGNSSAESVRLLDHKSTRDQKSLLSRHGVEAARIPTWQRHGVGLYWEHYEKSGYDPISARPVTAGRRRIKCRLDLPAGRAYSELLDNLLP